MSFDPVARFYGSIEACCAGGLMQRARTAHLAACPEQGRVLLAGEGHGRTLAALRLLRPGLKLTWLDASPAMRGQAQRCLARHGIDERGITFLTENAMDYPFDESAYDVIITPFFLDCFTPGELALLIPRLTRAARPDALWLVADFQLPVSGWRRRRAQFIHALLHGFFRKATGISARTWTDPDAFLLGSGWKLASRITFSWDLIRSDLWKRVDS